MERDEKRGFTAEEARRYAGYRTASMLDYLAREGIVVPSILPAPGKGRRRLYSFGDIVLLRALNRLLVQKVPVKGLKESLKTHRRLYSRISPESDLKRFLITDGKNVLFEEEPGMLVNLSKNGQLVFAFVVDMHQARIEVTRARNQHKAA